MTRVVLVVLDGVGVGALPDAADYGDEGSDTLGNLSRVVGLRLPFLERLGLGNITPMVGVPPVDDPLALTGRLATISAGKDTTVGHWEHMGLVTARPFPTYPDGFPGEVLDPFRERIGRGVLGNKPASGTVIIEELGAEHLATGRPIVYTSADGVFQLAAHVHVVPLEMLYEWCEIARGILQGPHGVARVIARPFTGTPGSFSRTKDRRDFSLPPPGTTYLDLLSKAGVPVVAIGKVGEVFVGRGFSESLKVGSNAENLALILELLEHRCDRAAFDEGLLFTNLVDFDMVWGHRNDVDGFAAGLQAVDSALPGIIAALEPGDVLLVTADHGVDPTTPSTDHSREYVPLLYYPTPADSPTTVHQGTLADTGATVFALLSEAEPSLGGTVLGRSRPSRGWRRPTPWQACHDTPGGIRVPGRVGTEEVDEAVTFLRNGLGDAPEAAVVLGSGLSEALNLDHQVSVNYREVPHWKEGHVSGHPYLLSVSGWTRRPVAFLEGRLHGYEGFDLSELQLPIRTLARWGVRKFLLTSACGAVAEGRRAGDVVVGLEMLDFQMAALCGSFSVEPLRLPATTPRMADAVLAAAERPRWLSTGVHVSVPGPNYETNSELEFLRGLGGSAISMSGGPELLAAREEGRKTAALSVIVNAGHTSHGGVLAGAQASASAFRGAVSAVLTCWGL